MNHKHNILVTIKHVGLVSISRLTAVCPTPGTKWPISVDNQIGAFCSKLESGVNVKYCFIFKSYCNPSIVLRVSQGSFKGVLKKSLNCVSKSFMCVSDKFQGCFQNDSTIVSARTEDCWEGALTIFKQWQLAYIGQNDYWMIIGLFCRIESNNQNN